MGIKQILDELAAEGGDNAKMAILKKYADNELLKKVLYKALSKRVKFYLKQIPEYPIPRGEMSLDNALESLSELSTRKVTGHNAIEFVVNLLSSVSEDDANVLERVIRKDLKIGMGRSNMNKVIPGLFEMTPYMGAKSFSEKLVRDIFKKTKIKSKNPETLGKPLAVSQIKMDGRYCNAIIDNGEVELESRQGETTYVGNAKFLTELANIKEDVVLNGELTIDGYDRYTANGMVSSICDIEGKRESRGEKETNKKIAAFEKKHGSFEEAINGIRFTVWDMITLDEYFDKKSDKPYHERLDKLTELVEVQLKSEMVSLIESEYVTDYRGAKMHFKDALERKLEGTLLKSLDGIWQDTKPSYQVKLKLEINLDLKIVGFNYGTKGTKNENVISTLRTVSSCGYLKTNPSGLKEEMMEYITENQDKLLGTIVEIRCCGVSQNSSGQYSTLHPSVVALRDDKDTANSLEECIEINNSALEIA